MTANRVAIALLASALGVTLGAATVTIGAPNREQVMHLAGDPGVLAAKLDLL